MSQTVKSKLANFRCWFIRLLHNVEQVIFFEISIKMELWRVRRLELFTFITYWSGVKSNSTPPIINPMFGSLGRVEQSIIYSPPTIGVPPRALLIAVTMSEGPAIKEVPVSAIALKKILNKFLFELQQNRFLNIYLASSFTELLISKFNSVHLKLPISFPKYL